MHFGFHSVTLNNLECLKGSVICNNLNWGPISQIWFLIKNRGDAVLTHLKRQQKLFLARALSIYELAGGSVGFHHSPHSGIQKKVSATI